MNFITNVRKTPRITEIRTFDHLGGFDQSFSNPILDAIEDMYHGPKKVLTEYMFDQQIQTRYPSMEFECCYDSNKKLFESFQQYRIHGPLCFKNFICSLNGSAHVSRKLLVSLLYNQGWFHPDYCSKNFSYSIESIDGHLTDFVGSRSRFFNKFFVSNIDEDFCQTSHSFGHTRFDHASNIRHLDSKLTASFLHIVSETMATSYYPFVTEKFLYSVVTRGLFLAYAQPGWHEHVERYYGFRRYTRLFDYRFDTIQNPVERLVELMSMISKFSVLSPDDWRDLYDMESDTIEFNYDHYFSRQYLKCLEHSTL